MLLVLVKKKFSGLSFNNFISKSIHNKAGMTANFKCSQILSLTAEKVPTNQNFPDQSKVKCSKLPKIIIKIAPINSNFKIFDSIIFIFKAI